MSLTFAEAGQIRNEGYVRINTLNDPPLVKLFYDVRINSKLREAFKINNKILEQTKLDVLYQLY